MDRYFVESKTFWGSILLGIEGGLMVIPGLWIWPEALMTAAGIWLTIYGIRDAL